MSDVPKSGNDDTNVPTKTTHRMEMGSHPQYQNPTKKEWIMVILAIFIELLASILFVIFIIWSFSANGMILFAWHPALMGFGYIPLMSEAILLYSNSSVISRSVRSHPKRVTFHWILETISAVSITLGLAAIVSNKFRHNKSHFYTNHAIVGLVTYIFLLLAIIMGVLARYSFDLRQYVRPILLKVLHSSVSLIAYILGGISIIIGMYSKWFEKNYNYDNDNVSRIFVIIAISLIWIYTCAKPLKLIFKRIHQMKSSI